MSLSKISRKQAVSKNSATVRIGGSIKVETVGGSAYSIATTKAAAFTEANSIVLRVNPKLDKIASAETLNAKAESAKEMFANYRNKK